MMMIQKKEEEKTLQHDVLTWSVILYPTETFPLQPAEKTVLRLYIGKYSNMYKKQEMTGNAVINQLK